VATGLVASLKPTAVNLTGVIRSEFANEGGWSLFYGALVPKAHRIAGFLVNPPTHPKAEKDNHGRRSRSARTELGSSIS